MQLKLNRYLFELRKNAIRFERIDINGAKEKSYFSRNFRRIICSIGSVSIVCALKSGFNSEFVSFISTVLSILIGLFVTAIIFSFDKFHSNTNHNPKLYSINYKRDDIESDEKQYKISFVEINEPSSKDVLSQTQSFNYVKQFAFITGYSIVLSIFALVLLSLSIMFKDFMSTNIFNYSFAFNNINSETIGSFINIMAVLFQRFLVLYWIGSIMYNTIFVVSSLVVSMTSKIDKEND